MSKLSFVAFCVENYAAHINVPSDQVYELFKKEKLLNLLKTDYEDLHGMGKEYLMAFFDDYLKNIKNSTSTHATVRSINIPTIIQMIVDKYSIPEFEALDRFYSSKTGANYADDETGLYGQSALYVFGMFVNEVERNN